VCAACGQGAEFADPQVNLFCSYDGGRTLQPSPSSAVNDTHIAYFELIGKVVGLALLHGETVPIRFSTPFLKRILGHTLTAEDLSLVDPEAYKRYVYCCYLLLVLRRRVPLRLALCYRARLPRGGPGCQRALQCCAGVLWRCSKPTRSVTVGAGLENSGY